VEIVVGKKALISCFIHKEREKKGVGCYYKGERRPRQRKRQVFFSEGGDRAYEDLMRRRERGEELSLGRS